MRCRFGTKREPPYEIPAGADDTLECTLEIVAAGEFSSQLHVFAGDSGLRETVLLVHGQAEAAPTEAKSHLSQADRGTK